MSSRVTVVGSERRLDAVLPDSVPVAEVLPDVVELLGENANGAAVEWGLVRVGGERLDPERSFAQQGVADGTMLFLRDVAHAMPAPTIEDFAELVAAAVDAQTGRWNAAMPATLLSWIAAASLGLAGVVVLATADASGRATVGVLGAVISGLAALPLVRVTGRRDLARIVMFGALPVWIAAGAGVAGLAGASAPAQVAAGLLGASMGAATAYAIIGEAAFVLLDGVLETALIPAVVLGISAAVGGGLVQAAAVLVVLELTMLAMQPLATARLYRFGSQEVLALARRLDQARRVAAASSIANALVIVASSVVLAVAGTWFGWALVAAAAVGTALRSRHRRFAAEVIPPLAAGIACVLLLELRFAAWLAIGVHGAAGLGLLYVADAIALVAAATAVRRWSLSPQLSRWLRPLEFVAVAATVPLALGVLGLYDAVAHLARHLG